MELGISTASYFPKLHTEDTLSHIASAKADICEIFFAGFSEYKDEFSEVLLDKLASANKIHPLKVHSVHAMTTQFEPELFGMSDRAMADAIEIYRQILKVAKKLGATHYTMHGPILAKKIKHVFNYERIANIANSLCDMAEEYGVKLCYENVHWAYFQNPDFFKILKPLCPKLGTVLDIKQARQSQYDYKEYLQVMGNRLETVHLCDYNTDGSTTIPGRGVVDFVELFKLLLDSGFNGAVLEEVYTKDYGDEANLLESFDYLKICLDKAKK